LLQVAGAIGIGLAFGGDKLTSWIDGKTEPEHAPAPAPAAPDPAAKPAETPAIETPAPTHEEDHQDAAGGLPMV